MDTNRLQKQAIKYKKYWLRHLQVFDKTIYQNKHYNLKNWI